MESWPEFIEYRIAVARFERVAAVVKVTQAIDDGVDFGLELLNELRTAQHGVNETSKALSDRLSRVLVGGER